MFTRRGERGMHANASVGYGTYETSSGTAGISGGSALARGSLQVAARHSVGFNAIVNPANFSYNPDRDGYRNGSVSASGSLTPASGQTLSLQLFRSQLDNQFDAGDNFNDRTITTLTSWQAATVNRLASWWNSNLSAGEGDDDSVSKTGLRRLPVQDAPASIRMAERFHAVGRYRDPRGSSDARSAWTRIRVSPSTSGTRIR